jgi:DNA-binding CsgD family transcriptional regulator
MLSLDDAYETVAAANSVNVVVSGLLQIAAKIGYDHVALAYTQPAVRGAPLTTATTYPLIMLDPILQHLFTKARPLVWDQRTYVETKTARIYDAFSAYGLGSGMTVSVRGASGDALSLGFTCAAKKNAPPSSMVAELGALCLAATATHHAFSCFLSRPATATEPVKLTPRELELLRWSRCGKTAWESSSILGISQATAQFHIKNAIGKLGAVSKQQAVLRALELRLIV